MFYCQGRSVPALAEHVAPSTRCTRLAADGAEVLTPEHLLAAHVRPARGQCPAGPGGAGGSDPGRERAAVRPGDPGGGDRHPAGPGARVRLGAPVWAADGERHVLALPADQLALTVATAFGRACAGPAVLNLQFPSSDQDDAAAALFLHHLAPARTFCFQDEVAAILAAGLGAGGSLENALVLSDEGPSRPLRFVDEPIRHKALDLTGRSRAAGLPAGRPRNRGQGGARPAYGGSGANQENGR